MIAVDTNILVYAHREETPEHHAAVRALTTLAEGPQRWALPVFCVTEFLRIITHRRIFEPPFTVAEATEALSRVTRSPSLSILTPGPRFLALLTQALVDGRATGNLVFDAGIVALCREHGVRALLTNDRDFRRFDGFATRPLT